MAMIVMNTTKSRIVVPKQNMEKWMEINKTQAPPTTRRATSKFSIVQQNNISRMNAEMLKSIWRHTVLRTI